jgi:hypothetical protein
MKIECYISQKCRSEKELIANIDKALKIENAEASVTVRRIEGAVARALGLRGSPSVLINGADIAPSDIDGFG